jgi:phage-related minor tail protein
MPDNKIKIGVELEDTGNSVSGLTARVKSLRDMLTSVVDTSKTISTNLQNKLYPGRSTGGGGGGGGGGGRGRVYASSMGEEPDRSYDQARGAIGTGAASRDFAKQSSGLGGFVRLYATLAANVYAAGAAFTALSTAADTTVMVKSMDQLGARSGRALGSLSKDLVDAADGAISLRDGLEATAKAATAGLSSDQILRMGDVAKKASQALGIAMPDALSRISRAISKIEPELVDELGLYTKIDKATQDYARSTGKVVDSLTDFEKRQAYANALIEEGEKKYAKLAKLTNPYAKLEASLKNVSQTTLEFVNKALGPVVELLASSPTALATVMGLVAATLFKQAIPAFGEFKENSQKALDLTLQNASRAAEAVNASALKRIGAEKAAALETAKTARAAADTATKIAQQAENDAGKAYKRQEEFFEKAQERAKKLNIAGIGSKVAKGILEAPTAKDVDPAALASLQKKLGDVTDPALASFYKGLIKNTEGAAENEKKFAAAKLVTKAAEEQARVATELSIEKEKEFQKVQEERYSRLSIQGLNQMRLNAAISDSIIRNIKNEMQSNIEREGFLKGMAGTYKELWKASREGGTVMVPIKDTFKMDEKGKFILDDMGKRIPELEAKTVKSTGIMKTSFGALTATIGGVGSALTTVLGALNPYIAVVGLLIGAVSLVKSLASDTIDETEATDKAIDRLTGASKNLKDTLDEISSKPFELRLDAESLDARATAVKTVTDSLVKSIKTSFAELEKMGGVDKFFDNLYSIAGKDVKSTLAKGLGNNIIAAFNTIDANSEPGKSAKASIESIVGVSITDSAKFKAAIGNLTSTDKEKIMQLIEPLGLLGNKLKAAAAKGMELEESFKQTNKAWQDFTNSFIQKDATTKLGVDLVKDAQKLASAINEPTQQLSAMYSLVTDVNKLQFFSPAAVQGLLKVRDQVVELNSEYISAGAQVDNLNKKIQDLEAEKQGLGKTTFDKALIAGAGGAGFAFGAAAGALTGPGAAVASPVVAGSMASMFAIAAANAIAIDTKQQSDRIDKQIDALKQQLDMPLKLQVEIQAEANKVKQAFLDASADLLVKGSELVSNKFKSELSVVTNAFVSNIAGMITDSKAAIEIKLDSDKAAIAAQMQLIQSNIDLMIMQKYAADMYEKATLEERKRKLEAMQGGEHGTALQTPETIKFNSEVSAVNNRLAKLTTSIDESKGGTVQAGKGVSPLAMQGARAAQIRAGTAPELTTFSEADVQFAEKIQSVSVGMAKLKFESINAEIAAKIKLQAQAAQEQEQQNKALRENLTTRLAILDSVQLTGEFGNTQLLAAKNELQVEKQRSENSSVINELDQKIAANKLIAKDYVDRGIVGTEKVVQLNENLLRQERARDAVLKNQDLNLDILVSKNATLLAQEELRVTTGRQLINLDLAKQLAEVSDAYANNYEKVKAILGLEKESFRLSQSKQLITAQQQVSLAQEAVNKAMETGPVDPKIMKVLQVTLNAAKSELGLLQAKQDQEKNIFGYKQKAAEISAREEENLRSILSELNRRDQLDTANYNLASSRLDNERTIIDAKIATNKLTEQEIQNYNKSYAIRKEQANFEEEQRKLKNDFDKAQAELQAKIAQAPVIQVQDLEEPSAMDSDQRAQLKKDLDALKEKYNLNTIKIDESNKAKLRAIEITNELSVQEKGFADIFTKGFESMADAMAEFIKTGKLNFKSLINSMIMDLIRFQLRSQMKELAGPGGGANFFAKLLSAAFNRDGGMPNFAGDYSEDLSGVQAHFGGSTVNSYDSAKGNAFKGSIEKFAMGGAFTNSIVRSPTLFKFANGTGLMGEAGPEAIMPLKRDASGTLGVRAPGNQGKVDIVVNNYSGQKAETRETTDSRGNRKVEVVVGEMSAGDISKPGSSSQQALRSNYGLQPALIRR